MLLFATHFLMRQCQISHTYKNARTLLHTQYVRITQCAQKRFHSGFEFVFQSLPFIALGQLVDQNDSEKKKRTKHPYKQWNMLTNSEWMNDWHWPKWRFPFHVCSIRQNTNKYLRWQSLWNWILPISLSGLIRYHFIWNWIGHRVVVQSNRFTSKMRLSIVLYFFVLANGHSIVHKVPETPSIQSRQLNSVHASLRGYAERRHQNCGMQCRCKMNGSSKRVKKKNRVAAFR